MYSKVQGPWRAWMLKDERGEKPCRFNCGSEKRKKERFEGANNDEQNA